MNIQSTPWSIAVPESHPIQTEEALQQVLYVLAHDLRNPVIGLRLVLNQLLQAAEGEVIPVPRAVLQRMLEGGDRQLSLINALLEAHSGRTDPLQPDRQPFQIATLLGDLVQNVTPCLAKNQATLNCQVAPDLPPVDADAEQIYRVFEQLIINALSHNPPGVHLTIDARLQGDALCCCVQDDGVGIPPEQQPYLFVRHHRGSSGRRTQGLGLGLYLCQQIIQSHGGTIQLAPSDQGAAIAFTLPLHSTLQICR